MKGRLSALASGLLHLTGAITLAQLLIPGSTACTGDSAPAAHRTGGDADAAALFQKSQRIGEFVPMRADMALTLWKEGRTVATRARLAQDQHGRYRMAYEAPREAWGRITGYDGIHLWQYEPRRHTLILTSVPVKTAAARRKAESLIERNYRVTLVSSREQAAGRPAYLIQLTPRHAGKGRQMRWIDRKTFKTLRVETHFADGSLARSISYSRVSLPARVSEAEFQPPKAARTRLTRTASPGGEIPAATQALRASSLGLSAAEPLGFELERALNTRIGGKESTQFLYSDGLETISVFVREGTTSPRKPPASWQRAEKRGLVTYHTVSKHTDALSWSRGGRYYTAVSHLEHSALESFVRGLVR